MTNLQASGAREPHHILFFLGTGCGEKPQAGREIEMCGASQEYVLASTASLRDPFETLSYLQPVIYKLQEPSTRHAFILPKVCWVLYCTMIYLLVLSF